MTEKYPSYEDYRGLYRRYYRNGTEALIALAQPLSNLSVLDLCGGDGRLTLKALEAGAREVVLVDREREMVPRALWQRAGVVVITRDVRFALSGYVTGSRKFDRVVCQQAVNYWLDGHAAQYLSQVLVPGGVFVFNTFNTPPPEEPRVLQYEEEGRQYVEVSWLVGDVVHHVQVCAGMPPHTTSFRWIPPEEFHRLLEPHFSVEVETKDRTSLYRCVKK